MLPTWMYLKGKDAIHVNLFIGSSVTIEDVGGTDVELVQVTDYPWKGDVSIVVRPREETTFALKIRAPRRSVSDLYRSAPDADGIASISVNGSRVTPPEEKGYVVVRRSWKPGDRIDLKLPMAPQRVKGIDAIEATRGKVALRFGPLVYNVERVDQDISKVLDPESALSTAWRGDLLGGVVVIEGTWGDGSRLVAIPNYARNNRDPEASSESGRRGGGPRSAGSIVWVRDR